MVSSLRCACGHKGVAFLLLIYCAGTGSVLEDVVRTIRIVLAAPFALLAISFDWMSARMEQCYDAILAADETTGAH